jgi:hypothetical protein
MGGQLTRKQRDEPSKALDAQEAAAKKRLPHRTVGFGGKVYGVPRGRALRRWRARQGRPGCADRPPPLRRVEIRPSAGHSPGRLYNRVRRAAGPDSAVPLARGTIKPAASRLSRPQAALPPGPSASS